MIIRSGAGREGLACEGFKGDGQPCKKKFWPRRDYNIRSLASWQGWFCSTDGDFCDEVCRATARKRRERLAQPGTTDPEQSGQK